MTPGYELRTVDLASDRESAVVAGFLARFGLGYDRAVDMTVLLRRDDEVVGTGSFAGPVLRNIAVDETLQGEGLTATLLNVLVQEQARRGILHRLIFTKPAAAPRFVDLGFREIARAAPWAVLLEGGAGSVDEYLAGVEKAAAALPKPRAAVVVNCNPFTLGHRGLIEHAAGEVAASGEGSPGGVIVFVVQEDRSLFPFEHRIDLVRRGLAHLPNVAVVPTGLYMVSSATFPTYFTREEHLADAQAHLDISLFAQRIAPRLGITRRFVGEEPYCAVTEAYNRAMRDILPGAGIEITVIPRFEAGGQIVSASTVRAMIRQDDWEGVHSLVPDVTWDYLHSPRAADIIRKIKASDSRH